MCAAHYGCHIEWFRLIGVVILSDFALAMRHPEVCRREYRRVYRDVIVVCPTVLDTIFRSSKSLELTFIAENNFH